MSVEISDELTSLQTLRDWLRYAVSRFNAADIVYGHGTKDALDEAAFLILSKLNLPIDQLEPWLDCRLTMAERAIVLDVILARVSTRKPAPYLTNSAWIKGYKFYVDERVIVPRSYIGELLVDGLDSVLPAGHGPRRILDLCTGSGCLAILAALAFPDAEVTAVDISDAAREVAARNIADYSLDAQITLVSSDLFTELAGKEPYDLIISNPPYVTAAAVAAFPPEYQAEPVLAHIGGIDGLDLINRILTEVSGYLGEGGTLIVEIGQARDALEARWPELPFLWLSTETSDGEVFALQREQLGKTTTQRSARKKAGRTDR